MAKKTKKPKASLPVKELKKGTKVEAAEHKDVTKGKKSIAKKIAKSHIKEDSKYYEHLSAMEKKAKKSKKVCKKKK